MGYDADGERGRGPGRGAARHRSTPECAVDDRCGWSRVTENPAVGATEVWEFYNTTGDAHPMHVHEVVFEVVNRAGPASSTTTAR